MSDCLPKFERFLASHSARKGGSFTHTRFYPAASYNFEAGRGKAGYADLDALYTHVCNLVKKGIKLTLTEVPGRFAPLRIDVDLKLSDTKNLNRRYTTEGQITPMVRMCQDIIADISDSPEDSNIYSCVVLEKPAPRLDQGFVKDGFHIHFPFFNVNSWVHDHIHSILNDRMLLHGIWNKTPFAENAHKILDFGVFHKTWLMYGCSKSLSAEPYLATHYYKVGAIRSTCEEIFEADLAGRKCSPEYYLPRFLSILDVEGSPIKDSINNLRAAALRKARAQINSRVVSDPTKNPDELIEEVVNKDLLSMLAPSRAYDYEEWYRVGKVLYSISQGSERGLELWDTWSRQDKVKYEPEACPEAWAKMKASNYTIGTLIWMAKQDSPDIYQAKRDEDTSNLIDHLIKSKLVPLDVARVFHKLYPDQFVCASPGSAGAGGLWYEFREHRWHKIDGISSIWNLMTGEFRTLFQRHRANLSARMTQAMETGEPERQDFLKKCEKNCWDLINELGEPTFQNKLISQLKHLYYDPKFLALRDENTSLWVCENGVLDLGSMTFRPGRPDDYCTYSCGLNYVEYQDDDPDVKTLEDFFRKVFVRDDYRNFFLDNVCSIMEGGNPNKNFIIGTGETNGGKSVTYSLLKTMCGGNKDTSYAYIFNRDLFINGRGNASGAARPELSNVRGKRMAMVNELSKTETINIGAIKEYTGNDSVYTRGLYKDPEFIKPMFKLFMHCNDPPKIPGHDDATWERAAFLPFESRFVLPHKLHEQPVPKTIEAQFAAKKFVADVGLEPKINQLAQAFLWMMFRRYQIYKQTGLVTPKSVMAATKAERGRHDIWQQFVDEKIVTVELDYPVQTDKDIKKDTPVVGIKQMHLEFTTWYKDAYPNSKDKIERPTMEVELSRKIGRPILKGRELVWAGKQIARDEGEEEIQVKH